MRIKLLTCLFLSFILCGCSWKEYFVLKNTSNHDITVRYSVEEIKSGEFPIFNAAPLTYGLNKRQSISWNEKQNCTDQDTSVLDVKVLLKPNSALIFGELSNDKYSNKNQYFINGRKFNFSMMEIENGAENIRITKKTFDEFFDKKNGEISYIVQ